MQPLLVMYQYRGSLNIIRVQRSKSSLDSSRFNKEDAEYSGRRDKLLEQILAEEQEALRLAEHRQKNGRPS